MIINNLCTDIELASPVYFIKDATCQIDLPQKVDSKNRMKVNFKTGVNQDTFGGALLYHLQRKEDTSAIIQLLVIWGYKFNDIYLHALLIEHGYTLVWDKDKLKMLYDVYNSRYNINFDAGEWVLNDNTELKTKCESSHGCFEMEVIISEEKGSKPRFNIPLWIDPDR
jgi:hypothetical protein